jgi:hypothetical protein
VYPVARYLVLLEPLISAFCSFWNWGVPCHVMARVFWSVR